MKTMLDPCVTALFLLQASVLRGSNLELPAPITVSSAGYWPAAAFNAVDRTWLVVWGEHSPISALYGLIFGRVVGEDGTFLTPAFPVSGIQHYVSRPRVAHDPIRNEWMVVWVGGEYPGESPFYRVSARKVGPTGSLLGGEWAIPLVDYAISWHTVDVAAAFIQDHPALPVSSGFVLVWNQTDPNVSVLNIVAQTLVHDPAHWTGIGPAGPVFRLDTGGEAPPMITSLFPRITLEAPMVPVGTKLGRASNHRVVFEAARFQMGAVYLASFDPWALRGVVRVSPEIHVFGPSHVPSVSWNRNSARTAVGYYSNQWGSNAPMCRLYEDTQASPLLQPLTDEWALGPWQAGVQVAPQLTSPVTFVSLNTFPSPYSAGLACLSGQTLVGDPTTGLAGAWRQSIAPHSNGGLLLAYEESEAIKAVILPTVRPPWNRPPDVLVEVVDEFVFVEGANFFLDGSRSSDPDGDPLRFQWTQLDGGDFFIDPGEKRKPRPELRAPVLRTPGVPLTVTFELAVDDLRSFPPFPARARVRVTIKPASIRSVLESSPRFRRADADGSGRIDIGDAVDTLGWLFLGGEAPTCLDAADANDDGSIALPDALFTLEWLFGAGGEPPPPGPFECGRDETPDALSNCSHRECEL